MCQKTKNKCSACVVPTSNHGLKYTGKIGNTTHCSNGHTSHGSAFPLGRFCFNLCLTLCCRCSLLHHPVNVAVHNTFWDHHSVPHGDQAEGGQSGSVRFAERRKQQHRSKRCNPIIQPNRAYSVSVNGEQKQSAMKRPLHYFYSMLQCTGRILVRRVN